MEHPELQILIQKSIREDRLRNAERQRRLPKTYRVNRIRVVAGNVLMAAGARIAAAPRQVNPGSALGEISVVGGTEKA